MRLRHIEVFHAVYSSGSITQAAKILNVSQPSVSKVLAHAEIQLGFALFDRLKGKLVPTPEAERLYDHVQSVFEDLSRVKRVALNLQHSAEGKIRVASTPAMGVNLLPVLVGNYMKKNTDIIFELETLHHSEITSALEESRIDIALAFDPPNSPGISETKVAQGELVLITPANTIPAKPDYMDSKNLLDLPFIRLNSRGPLGRLLDAHIDSIEAELNIVAITETYHLAGSLVAQGVGVAIVDQVTANNFRAANIEIIRLSPTLTFDVSILQLDQLPLSRVCQKFAVHLADVVQNDFELMRI